MTKRKTEEYNLLNIPKFDKNTHTHTNPTTTTTASSWCALIFQEKGGLGVGVVREGPPLHLLSCLCHQGLLLHFNDKVAEPLTLHPSHTPPKSFQ